MAAIVEPAFKAEEDVAARRLGELLGYVEQLIKLDERPATRLSQHKLSDGSQFILHQHELSGLPGVHLDSSDADGPIWLRMERLQRTNPPPIGDECQGWIEISSDPLKTPALLDIRHMRVLEEEKNRLTAAGEARPDDCAPSLKSAQKGEPPGSYFDITLRLEDRPAIREALEAYCSGPWAEWSEGEKPRRRSIAVYQRLFEIAQRLLQSGGTEAAELIWGIGIARWNRPEESIDIPMIERSVEIEIADQSDAAITVRPRSTTAHVELRPFEKLAPEKLILAEDAARRCLRGIEIANAEGVSPFKGETYEPILKICGSQLDPEGGYLPDHRILPDAEPVPAAEGSSLTVADRYVLFARRRAGNAVLQDIERFKTVIAPTDAVSPVLEGATRTLVMGPSDGISDVYQPLGDKIGATDSIGREPDAETVDPEHGDLFFPKPFNDDQVQIIRRLEKSDGLVVQGPPGTGKTHTIANIISHMLATGRRVLVVSHGDTALRVIRDQLPEGVRDLTISVAGSDRESLKQVERAINLMLGIVNLIDSNHQRQRNLIRELEASIVKGRKRLSEIDARLAAIASEHLSPVPGGSESPYQTALRVVEDRARYEWFTDRPSRIFADTGIDEARLARLADARKRVNADLEFIHERLPSPANLPDARTLLEWHRDLVAAKSLDEAIAATEPQLRRIVAQLGLEGAEALALKLKEHAGRISALMNEPWVWGLIEWQTPDSPSVDRIRGIAKAFLAEADQLVTERAIFVATPVSVPAELPPQPHRDAIFNALTQGKNPFGLLAIGLRPYRETIEQIRVAGLRPDGTSAWQHVRTYVTFHEKLIGLSSRWASLRGELLLSEEIHFGPDRPAALDAVVDGLRAALVEHPAACKQVAYELASALGSRDEAAAILDHRTSTAEFGNQLASFVAAKRLSAVREKVKATVDQFRSSSCPLAAGAIDVLSIVIGNAQYAPEQIERVWTGLRARLAGLRNLEDSFQEIIEGSAALAEAGSHAWSERLRTEPASRENDPCIPADWKAAWDWAARLTYLERIGASNDLSALHRERLATEEDLRNNFAKLVKERTFFNLAASMKGSAKAALNAFAQLIRKIGKGTGKGAVFHRRDAREAMERCYDAVPCWIMPTWRVSEQLPVALGAFDLVILDEASQSDVRELPALLRGKKVLVVGDDRQVSPSAAFLSLANIQRLRANYLGEFPYPGQVEPGASMYDLARVMFPDKFVMLKEHFRCVEPIIRFSMQFYDEPLVPLRVPKGHERLAPPLIDILVEDGERRGKSKVNPREAEVIVDEIERIVADPALALIGSDERRPRSIGVISLIGSDQAAFIRKKLMDRIGEAAMVHHRIMCGDSATFQGDERDIVFLSMIADRKRKQAQTALQYEQRFNVALSRARDRMILVRSVTESDLNPNDLKAKVIRHFAEPMPSRGQTSAEMIDLCQSGFERDLFSKLVEKGYRVIPQVGSEGFSIDMVVEGDAGRRLAIECDGDRYHGPEKWADDMRRQRILERVGWTFWRCFGSNYTLDKDGVLADLFGTLERMGITPAGTVSSMSQLTEHRVVRVAQEDDASGEEAAGSAGDLSFEAKLDEVVAPDTDAGLVVGDRIMIRYLDDPQARQECYILTDKANDPVNGFLTLSSPLAQALSDASPGEEVLLRLNDRDRPVLFMSLDRERRKAA